MPIECMKSLQHFYSHCRVFRRTRKRLKALEPTVAVGCILQGEGRDGDMSDSSITAKRSSCEAGGFVLPGDPPPRLASAAAASCCGPSTGVDTPTWRRVDWMLWGSGAIIVVSYLAGFVLPHDAPLGLGVFTHGVQEMMNLMWWGILVGMLAVGLIDRVPRQFVIGVIGRDQGATSLVRAVLAGVLLDLCNHGVLMVGAKLYERGASLGQVFAFLIASPWNSLSL